MTDDSVPISGSGQVEAAIELSALTDGDQIWVLVDGGPPMWHRLEVVAVEPILGQTRFQAWILGRDRGDVYRFRVRTTLTDDGAVRPSLPSLPANRRERERAAATTVPTVQRPGRLVWSSLDSP